MISQELFKSCGLYLKDWTPRIATPYAWKIALSSARRCIAYVTHHNTRLVGIWIAEEAVVNDVVVSFYRAGTPTHTRVFLVVTDLANRLCLVVGVCHRAKGRSEVLTSHLEVLSDGCGCELYE